MISYLNAWYTQRHTDNHASKRVNVKGGAIKCAEARRIGRFVLYFKRLNVLVVYQRFCMPGCDLYCARVWGEGRRVKVSDIVLFFTGKVRRDWGGGAGGHTHL